MGLFTKKDPCAICGGKVKGLLPWKIDGQYICNDCYGTVDLPDGAVNNMTVEAFKAYRAFREENQKLRDQFNIERDIDFGWWDTKFVFDLRHRLMCLDKSLNKTIFEGSQIKSFVIREDASPLYEGDANGLRCYTSTIPERARALEPEITRFRMEEERRRNLRDLHEAIHGKDDDRDFDDRVRFFNVPEPFKKFIVEIRFQHPYWGSFTADMSAPSFDNTYPDVSDYLSKYQESKNTMEQLAKALMAVAYPGKPEIPVGADGKVPTPAQPAQAAPAAAAPAVDAVTEIQRFKTLLDQGIITEEEFAAKKKQLLGI